MRFGSLQKLHAPDAGAGAAGSGGGSAGGGQQAQGQQGAASGSDKGGGGAASLPGSVLSVAGGDGKKPEDGGNSAPAGDGKGNGEGGQKQGQEGQQQEGQQQQKPVVPESYKFTAPEGSTIQADVKAIEAFSPIAKELGLSQEAFDKVAGFYAKHVETQVGERNAAHANRINAFAAEALKLPPEVRGAANRALNQLADAETLKLFTASKEEMHKFGAWVGVHPGIIKLLAKAGDLLKEDTPPGGNGGGGGERNPANILFGNLNQK